MQPEGQLTLPLWRLLWRGVVRVLTFEKSVERWSNLSAVERAERRARWPVWRRAVRPVGLALFWFQALLYVAMGDDPGSVVSVLRFGSILLLLPIVGIGVRDWFRDVPPRRADRGGIRIARYRHRDPARSTSSGVVTERPLPERGGER